MEKPKQLIARLNLYKKSAMLKYISMRKPPILLLVLIVFIPPLEAQSHRTPFLCFSGMPGFTVEPGYDALMHGAVSLGGGLSFGESWGGIVQTGAMYQGSSSFSSSWYRYRGFFGLYFGGGPRFQSQDLTASIQLGGVLARYDMSYSYFFFPYIEPGASYRLLSMGKRLGLELGASIPLFLRADVFSAGIKATLTMTIQPKTDRTQQPGAEP
jgi:hypothetical protein